MRSGLQQNIHLRGDDQRIEAATQEGSDWSSLTIKAGVIELVFYFHQEKRDDDEPNGFTDEAIMRSIDELMEELVRMRTKAMQRIRHRQILRDAEVEKAPMRLSERAMRDARELTQDECDILGLDNRERLWRYGDLTFEQKHRLASSPGIGVQR